MMNIFAVSIYICADALMIGAALFAFVFLPYILILSLIEALKPSLSPIFLPIKSKIEGFFNVKKETRNNDKTIILNSENEQNCVGSVTNALESSNVENTIYKKEHIYKNSLQDLDEDDKNQVENEQNYDKNRQNNDKNIQKNENSQSK